MVDILDIMDFGCHLVTKESYVIALEMIKNHIKIPQDIVKPLCLMICGEIVLAMGQWYHILI